MSVHAHTPTGAVAKDGVGPDAQRRGGLPLNLWKALMLKFCPGLIVYIIQTTQTFSEHIDILGEILFSLFIFLHK